METDRRENMRVKLTREVMLSADRMAALFCETRDISTEGMYIEMGETNLTRDTVVEVTISLPVGEEEKTHKLRARVMRVSDTGAGLQFDGLEVGEYSALLGLMYAA